MSNDEGRLIIPNRDEPAEVYVPEAPEEKKSTLESLKKRLSEFGSSLLTRKFLLAVGGFLTLLGNGAYGEAVAVLIAYIGAEGIADSVERYQQ